MSTNCPTAEPDRVAEWVARLGACDPSDLDRIEQVLAAMPLALHSAVADRGGPAIRERLFAPALARAEREGTAEWTGEYDDTGLKVWRVL